MTTHITKTDYEWIGVEHEQCFPGTDIAMTDYTHAFTGTGDSYADAIDDVWSQMSETFPDHALAEIKRQLMEIQDYALDCEKRAMHPEICAWYADAEDDDTCDAMCPLHVYVVVRVRAEERPMIVKLDNHCGARGSDHYYYGRVLVTTHPQDARDDQTIDGSSWETPGDLDVGYAYIQDRPTLICELRKAGYTHLDLSEYEPPSGHDVVRWEAIARMEEHPFSSSFARVKEFCEMHERARMNEGQW